MRELLIKNSKVCTGCEACSVVCPVNAIEMVQDHEGFFVAQISKEKCINCGRCKRTCPQLNCVKNNNIEASCYAVYADEKIRKRSSSGGAFTVLANYVFANGGVVCGAAFNSDYRSVYHIMISNPDDLDKIRKSKYVFCKPGDIYRQIVNKLEEGVMVLFASTPCQIAALNNVVAKEYDNLIIVDIFCTGVPSPDIWKKYLDEKADGRTVKGVDFRCKDYDWACHNIKFEFEDGKNEDSLNDVYSRCFLNGISKCKACVDCQYAVYPRHGDFTIGDFWAIEKAIDIDTKLGVSCITVNNVKAQMIFGEILNKFEYVKEMPLNYLLTHNNASQYRKENLARKRFFHLVYDRKFPVIKALDYSIGWKFDVAVSGCWTVPNYGGELSYYALYRTINSFGKTVIMVERRKDISGYDVPKPGAFRRNPYPYYDVSRIHKNFDDQKELNNRVDSFVLGSDQIWNYKLMCGHQDIMSYSFDYVEEGHRKIAYASSFGTPNFTGTEAEKAEFSRNLSTFYGISVREKSGALLATNLSGNKVINVLDPVFLCDKAEYNKLALNATIRSHDHIFAYILAPDDSYNSALDLAKISDILGVDLRIAISLSKDLNKMPNKNVFSYAYENNLSIEDWLYLLIKSRLVITTSFHAVCFSIIFHKEFIFIKGQMMEENGYDRIRTILDICGLTDRVYFTLNDAMKSDVLQRSIDWEVVDKKLQPEIERSRNWLKNMLGNNESSSEAVNLGKKLIRRIMND